MGLACMGLHICILYALSSSRNQSTIINDPSSCSHVLVRKKSLYILYVGMYIYNLTSLLHAQGQRLLESFDMSTFTLILILSFWRDRKAANFHSSPYLQAAGQREDRTT